MFTLSTVLFCNRITVKMQTPLLLQSPNNHKTFNDSECEIHGHIQYHLYKRDDVSEAGRLRAGVPFEAVFVVYKNKKVINLYVLGPNE